MVVDYRRWEALAAAVDDEDSGEEAARRARPQVTRFDRPTSVTIGGTAAGGTAVQPAKRSEGAQPSLPAPSSALPPSGIVCDNRSAASAAPPPGDALIAQVLTDRYAWEQDATTLTVLIFVDDATRARELAVRRHGREVSVASKAGAGEAAVLFREELSFTPLDDDDDDHNDGDSSPPRDGEEYVDWALEWWSPPRSPSAAPSKEEAERRRAVRITLRKKAPAGTVMWCERAFATGGEAAIDTTRLAARSAARRRHWREAGEVLREPMEDFRRRVAAEQSSSELPADEDSDEQQRL